MSKSQKRLVGSLVLLPILVALISCGREGSQASFKATAGQFSDRDVIPPNSLEPIEKVVGLPFYDASRSVARASLDGYCTAIRVSKSLFMTNKHCFLDTTCERTTFTLAYEAAIPENKRPVFQCKEVVMTHFMLDYALARVEETTSLDSLKEFPSAKLAKNAAQVGLRLFMSGHPMGRKKEIDRSEQCQITDITFDSIDHTCDSEPGSSGAPLFDKKTLQVIGLNWGGAPEVNGATAMSGILADIKEQNPAIYNELNIGQ